MEFLTSADWAVIIVYLGGIIGLGVSFGRDQNNLKDYFLGSKNTAWWGIGFSIIAAETSALTVISVPAIAFGSDISFLQIIFGYVIARILLAYYMVPLYFAGEIYSPYQLLERSFGPAARKFAASIFLLSETLAAGVRVYVVSIPITLMFGKKMLALGTGDPVLGAILLFVILSLIYTYIGGVKAVIWTDAVQFLLFFGGGLFTLLYIPTLINGGWSAVLSEAQTAGKLHLLNLKFSLSMPFNLAMGLIGGTFVVLSSHGAEQLIVQRVLACKNIRDGRKALLLSAVFILPLFLIFLLVGVFLFVYFNHAAMAIPLPEVRDGSGIKKNDYIYPIFMLTVAPPVIKGALIVAILAAAMSSVSSALTALASVATLDFAQPFLLRKNKSPEEMLRFSKLFTVFWAGMLVLVAYLSREVDYVLNAAFNLRGLTSGALLGSLLLVVFWRKGSGIPIIAGGIASVIGMTILSRLEWHGGGNTSVSIHKIAWPWFTLIGTSITISVAWLTRLALERRGGTSRV